MRELGALRYLEGRRRPTESEDPVVARRRYSATELIRGPGLPFPDLLDQENATRLALAEKVQAGKMTIIERNQQFSQFHSQIIAEEQRRMLANRSVNAQESAAAAQWRASNPVSCTKIGNTVNCY